MFIFILNMYIINIYTYLYLYIHIYILLIINVIIFVRYCFFSQSCYSSIVIKLTLLLLSLLLIS